MFIQKLIGKIKSLGTPKNNNIPLHYGENCVIAPTASFFYPERITIGDGVYIGTNSSFYGCGGINIESHSIISHEVCIMSSMHRHDGANMIPYDEIELLDKVQIGLACWIGLRAIIMPGVTLGDGAIVGVGALVTKSVEPGHIVVGNPAKTVKIRDMDKFRALARDGQFYLSKKLELGLQKTETLRTRN